MADQCEILKTTEAGLERAARLLQSGRLVAVPTETVYGLAANALDESASRKIFSVKGRPLIDPLIVHFEKIDSMLPHVEVNPAFDALAAELWPGPLTIVVNKKPSIPDIVTAGLKSVAVRISAHATMHRLLQIVPFPLAAPSANPFGYLSPTRPEHVVASLGARIAAVIDAGPTHHGLESTIVDVRNPDKPALLRPGPYDKQALESILGRTVHEPQGPASGGAQAAPGMLERHYSPNSGLALLEHGCATSMIEEFPDCSEALVLFKRPEKGTVPENVYWLSEDGSLEVAAAALFEVLNRLDQTGVRKIHIEKAPDTGIGTAINDRLRRAAAR